VHDRNGPDPGLARADTRPDSYNLECADPLDTSGKCHPYANIMDIPTGDDGIKWRMSCDEFPFGKSSTSSCVPGTHSYKH
jgi:hypothetical protein